MIRPTEPEPVAEETPAEGALPAHRVALRAATAGPIAGVATAALITLVALLGPIRGHEAGMMFVLASVACSAWSGLFLVAEGVAAHARPAARLPVLVATGSASGALAAAATVWVGSILFSGRTPLDAWEEVERLVNDVLVHPDRTLPVGAAVFVPFVALAAARGRGAGRRLQAVAAGLAGLLAFGLCCACWGTPGRHELPTVVPIFVGAPVVSAVALSFDARILGWVLARIERWRARADEG